jgi:hypothetical protein
LVLLVLDALVALVATLTIVAVLAPVGAAVTSVLSRARWSRTPPGRGTSSSARGCGPGADRALTGRHGRR